MFILLQFSTPEVQIQGVVRAMLPPESQGEALSCLPSSGALVLFGLCGLTPALCLRGATFPLYLSVS